jgi:hypothetical protein
VGKHFFGRQSDTITPTVCYFAFVACPKVGVKAQDAAAQICEPTSAEIASSKMLAQMSFRAMVERAVDSSLDYTSTARLAGKHGNLAQPATFFLHQPATASQAIMASEAAFRYATRHRSDRNDDHSQQQVSKSS